MATMTQSAAPRTSTGTTRAALDVASAARTNAAVVIGTHLQNVLPSVMLWGAWAIAGKVFVIDPIRKTVS
jgi:hypothetical protein